MNEDIAKEIKKTKFILSIVGWSSLGICAILFVLFLLNRDYDCSWPFDTGIFGAYGDFIGGFIGTIVAIFSAYLLVRTLQNQLVVNDSVVETNKSVMNANNAAVAANQLAGIQTQMQLFDNRFQIFMNSYLASVSAYTYQDDDIELTGRRAFEKITESFESIKFTYGNDYYRRNKAATMQYCDFYANHRINLSVHLRLLYLLASLISNSELEEDDKVSYAKLVRGQLSDSEMLLLRYNCCSDYGMKMRDYCNTFNFIKHVSMMRLLEFRKYYDELKSSIGIANVSRIKAEAGALDALFITIRKKAQELLYADAPSSIEYSTGKRYHIQFVSNADCRNVIVTVSKHKKAFWKGGGLKEPAVEVALDRFSEDILEELFRDFLTELFCISNFHLFNDGMKNIGKAKVKTNDTELVCTYTISNSKRLVLTKIQYDKRNQPNIVNEYSKYGK